ncbi:MAG TPA: hypothetical protein VGI39_17190 [Polyangiaceae bacterium]
MQKESPIAVAPTHVSTHWESRGIGGGGAFFGPSINPFDEDDLYVVTDMTGVFHSTDFGRAWKTLPFQTIQGNPASSLQWTSDPEVLFAINNYSKDDSPLFQKSMDGGATWTTLVPSPDPITGLAVDRHRAGRLLVADANALNVTHDGGTTFVKPYVSPSPGSFALTGALFHGKDIFAGTSDGLLVSRDGGVTFSVSSVPGVAAGDGFLSFSGAHEGKVTRLFAVGSSGAVYGLTDGDPAWSVLTPPVASTDQALFVGTAENNVDVAYVAAGDVNDALNDAVFKTKDGGRTWAPALLTKNNQNVATGWAGTGGWAGFDVTGNPLGFAVAPYDADRVVLTDYFTVHVTEDGAANWRAAYVRPQYLTPAGQLTPLDARVATSGLDNTSVWSLLWTDEHTIFASVTDDGSERSDDGGRTWVRAGDNGLALNTTYHAVRSAASGLVYAGTSSRHDIYQSSTLTDDPIDQATGAIMVSADGGRHFETLEDIGHPVIFLALDPHDPASLYASVVSSLAGGIYRKDLSAPGTPAVRLTSPPRTVGHPFNVRVLDDGSLLASYCAERPGTHAHRGPFTPSSGVFLSSDKGKTWSDRSAPEMRYWTKDVVVDPHDATQSTWYAGVYSSNVDTFGGLYRTRDRGLTWTRLVVTPSVESITVHPTRPDFAFYTTERLGLFMTQNLNAASPTFNSVADFQFRQPLRVFFNPSDAGEVWVTSFGGGIRVAHL